MDNLRLRQLLRRLRQNSLRGEEMEELDNWYHQLKGGRHDFESWVQEQGGEEGLKTHLYSNFNKKLGQRHRAHQRMIWYRVAAILVVALTVGWFIIRSTQLNAPREAAIKPVKAVPQPASNKATLILANGNSVQLDNATDCTMRQAGVNVKKVGNGKLVYTGEAVANQQAAVAYNTIITPRGGQYQLVLQDGSKVWLNSESRLRYPVHFTGKERRVELEGEAYFEVVHNRDLPFRVVTGEVTTTDLGTHFNIRAYGDDSKIAATLLEGSVNVNDQLSGQTQLLIPGKQAKIRKGDGKISISNAQVDEVMAWKNGYFIFDNEDIRQVMKQISRWYDVDVTYQLTRNVRVGGTFSRSENLDKLLQSFELIGNIHCERKERRIIVSN